MRNKKLLFVVTTLVFSMLGSTFLHAAPDDVTGEAPKPLYVVENKESLPFFANVTDAEFADKINAIVSEFHDAVVSEAGTEETNGEVTFSYETKGDEKYLSVIIKGVIAKGETKAENVKTIVLDWNEYKLYTLIDILGTNAYAVADDYIKATSYGADTPVLDETTNFYMDKDSLLTVLSNTGVAFTLDLTKYLTFDFTEADFYKNETDAMVPLRKLAETFGYTVEWDAVTSTAYVAVGEVKLPVNAGIATNTEYSLTTAPELKEDRLFVPISFADILGISHVVSTDMISLAKLTYTVPEKPVVDPETEKTDETEETEKTDEVISDKLSVKGEVIDIAANILAIKAESGFELSFDITYADTSEAQSLKIGDTVEVFYTGEIHNEFTNEAVVTRVVTIG